MRPYVLLKAAVSLDGYIDDSKEERLILSSPEDLAEVDKIRSNSDAILVGAATIRKDNPSLLCSTKEIIKITLTNSGKIDPNSNFFQKGKAKKYIFTSPETFKRINKKYKQLASIFAFKDLNELLSILKEEGIEKLLVEGGSEILTQFLQAGCFDDFRLAVCPKIIADKSSPKLTLEGYESEYNLSPCKRENLGNTTVIWLNSGVSASTFIS